MRKFPLTIWIVLLIVTLAFVCVAEEEYEEYPEGLIEYQGFYYLVKPDDTAEIYSWSYYDNDAVGVISLTIPEELDGHAVTSISPDGHFYSNVASVVTLPDCLIEIPGNPFEEIFELNRIDVSPDHPTLATIDGVLYNKADKRLVCYPRAKDGESFQIPDGIKSIGDNAFAFARFLHEVTFPEGLETIGAHAFECCELVDVTFPITLMSIGDQAFAYSSTLETVSIQDNGIKFGESVFKPCRSLRAFYVSPDNPELASIDGVLYSKTEKCLIDFPAGNGLQSFSVPDGIETIGEYAFLYCSELFMVELPNSCKVISKEAFAGCESLNTIIMPDTLTIIGDFAFRGCDFSRIWIPEDVTVIGKNPFISCYRLSEIEVSPESQQYATIDNVLFDKLTKILICYPPQKLTDQIYQIPDGIKGIGNYAFPGGNLDNLDMVIIPDTVEWIGENALDQLYCKIQVERDGFAAQYCKEHGLDYVYSDADSWLTN